jgi:glycosyltransferase involved in cell wall biosynthesis
MQKLLFYTKMNFGNVANRGIANKVHAQVKAFENLRIETDLFYVDNNNVCLEGKHPAFRYSAKSKFKFLWFLYVAYLDKINIKQYSYIYIRHFMTNPLFLFMLWRIKKRNPAVKIFLEIPTFPYKFANNNLGFISKISQIVDSFCTLFFTYFIEKIITFSTDDMIFGISTIKIDNGIDVEKNPMIVPHRSEPNTIHLFGLANVQIWHGFDRILEGMKVYITQKEFNQTSIVFHVVGQSGLINELKDKVQQLGLQSNVIFHGFLTGKELEQMFAICHVGVSALAMHRVHLNNASPLKSREFVSRGLPFITAHEDEGFPYDYPFILKFSNDDSAIDMQEVIKFVSKLNDYPTYWQTMNQYAKDNFTWESKLKIVVDKFRLIK